MSAPRTSLRRAPSLAHLPGPRGPAFVRLMLHFVRDSLGALEASHAQYGDVVAYHWPINTVILYDPAAIRHVLRENQAAYEKGAQTEELAVLMGAGLVTNNDRASWARRRPVVNRALSAAAVRRMLPSLDAVIEEEVAQLDETHGDGAVDLSAPMRQLSFRIACQVLLGDAVSPVEARTIDDAVLLGSHVVHRHMFSLLRAPYWVPLWPHLRLARARRRLDAVMARLIERARASPPGEGILSRLVHTEEDGARLTDREIRDEVVTLLIAGYETTANAITWTLSLLAHDPMSQAAVHAEAVGSDAVDLRALRASHRSTAMVIAESLRLYPTIPMTSRRALVDDVIGEQRIPAGTNVVVPTWNVHRDPRWWPDPERFCPARFGEDSTEACPSYLPFSRGERGCVGRTFALVEIANVVLAMVRRFELLPVAASMPRAVSEVSLRPARGAPVRLVRRTPSGAR